MNKDLALNLAQRVQRIKPSPTLAISTLANELRSQGKNIINLSVGEPDFDTPGHIKEAAIQAIQDGKTKYTPVDGTKTLKEAIINKLKVQNQLDYDVKQILVSSGAKHSIYNVLSAVLNAGDEVIIPAPFWVSYPDMVKLCDGEPVILKTEFEQSFKITPNQLSAAITDKTRVLFLNSPSNPTGLAYTKDELAELAKVILKHPGIIVISDDIYEHSLFGDILFTNIVNACPELYDRTVIINGVSKAYAMTGWRIGFAAGPEKLIGAMKKAQSQSTSCPSSVSQYAAEAAFSGDHECVKKMTAAFKERHDFILSELNAIDGIQCIPSNGTFYTFPSVQECMQRGGFATDVAFVEYLLEKAEVAVVPGSAFGAPGHIRMSFATSMDNLKKAIVQIKLAIAELD